MTATRKGNKSIARYVDGSMAEAERQTLGERAERDAELGDEVQEVTRLVQALRDLGSVEPPLDCVAVAMARRPSPRPNRRWHLGLAVGLSAALAAAAATVVVVLIRPEGPPQAPQETLGEPIGPASRLVASATSGISWWESAGGRHRLGMGMDLGGVGIVATDPGGRVTLKAGEGTEVDVGERSRLRVHRRKGMVEVLVQVGVAKVTASIDGASSITIQPVGTGHEVLVTVGTVGVLHDGGGSAVVACEAGRAKMRGHRGTIELTAGQQVAIRDGVAGEPHATDDLYLQVTARRVPGSAQARVVGRARPGAEVWVDDARIDVGPDGGFERAVQLQQGSFSLRVVVRDALMRREERVLAVGPTSPRSPRPKAPGSPPRKDGPTPPIETQWQWEKSPG